MKRSIVLLTFLCSGLAAIAQKSKVRDARDYLSDNNYKKAIPIINEAVAHEETKNSPDAWYLRGMAYLQQSLDTTSNEQESTTESYNSLMTVLRLKPDYGPEINNALYSSAVLAFNKAVAAYSAKDYSSAYDNFMKVQRIYDAGGAARFASQQGFSELIVNARTNAAYSALSAKKDTEALGLFTEIKNTSGKMDSIVYQSIIDIHQRKGNEEAALAVINEARSKFPASQLFRNLELNYYIKSGRQDVLLGKLQAALAEEPNNPELLFNIANLYERAAFPKDASGASLARPDNYSDMFSKAEASYLKAIANKPTNPDYQYNLGVLYYEVAGALTRQLNEIKGTGPEDNKRYDEILARRNAEFAKASPYFEAAYSLLDGRAAGLTAEERITYRNAMIGMREIYSRNNEKDKAEQMKAKLNTLSN